MELTTAQDVTKLASPFLGNVVEICIITHDYKKTIDGLLRLGIGPFQIHTFNSETVTEQTFRGKPAIFELKVCFANQGSVVWEIMQPVSGQSIMTEFLENRGEGIHHIASDCNHIEPVERRAEFERRGFGLAQSGVWHGKKGTCEFMFFDTEGAIATCFESYCFSADWEDPETTVWYPHPVDLA